MGGIRTPVEVHENPCSLFAHEVSTSATPSSSAHKAEGEETYSVWKAERWKQRLPSGIQKMDTVCGQVRPSKGQLGTAADSAMEHS